MVFALEIKIKDPCTGVVAESISVEILAPIQLSKLLFELFENYNIPFVGASNGIKSLLNTPYGEDAIFIDDIRNIRSYGWCYAIDGIQPSVTIDNYTINGDSHSLVEWVFGMAQMIDGKWVSYCTPVYQLQNIDAGICKL